MKIKVLWVFICLLGSFFVPISLRCEIEDARFCRSKIGISLSNIVLAANSDIVINEIGAYEASGHEWIEIWNKGSESVDLTGWKFWENNTNHGLSVSSTDAVLAAGEYAVIVQDAFQFLLDYPSFSGSVFDSSWGSLNESGEEIGLKDADGNFVEQFTYVSAPDFSLQRQDPFLADYSSANWAEHISSNTVGALNVFESPVPEQATTTPEQTLATPPTPPESQTGGGGSTSQIILESLPQSLTPIKINEFVSDPEMGNEWVELYNNGSENLDLAGAMICDNRNTTSICKKISGAIGPNSWFFMDLLTKSFLNNGGDSVIFKDALGKVIDRIDYADELAPDKGQSLARKTDGVDTDSENDWAVTNYLTPGAANSISEDSSEEISKTNTESGSISKKSTTNKEKFIGLKWKIKYDLRLRQYEEGVFDAASSIDPRGGRINYNWSLGGQTVDGASVQYAFTTSGTHIVIVRATSTAGTVDEKKITIMVYPATEIAGAGIIFSEILPRAASEEEYIKIKNISGQAVNMSNWKIIYKNSIFEIPSSTFLAANDYLTFYQTITGFTLNNSGAELLLLNQENILIDEMEYGKAEEDVAYVFDGQKWNWATQTTTAKVIVANVGAAVKKSSGKFYTNIVDARAGQKGDYARLTGVVAVLPGVFGSQYFYLVSGNLPAGEAGAGIQIYQNKKDFPPLEVGDSVEVYGMVSEANGIKRINIKSKDDVDILSIDNAVTSTQLNVDDIDESLAGGLVWVEGEITEIKSSFMYVDNGIGEVVVYFKQGAQIDKSQFKEGENVRVAGIFEQTKTGWQIWPRSGTDVESLGPSADLLSKEIVNTSSTEGKYLTATAGGISALILGFLARARGLMVLGGIKKVAEKFTKKG